MLPARWVNYSLVLSAFLGCSQSLLAQTDLPAESQATVMVEVDFAKLRKNVLYKALEDIEGNPVAEMFPNGRNGKDWTKLERIAIRARLPQDMQQLMQAQMEDGGELPMDFLLTMSSSEPGLFSDMVEQLLSQGAADTLDGINVARPGMGPANLAVGLFDDKHMFIGTDDYVVRRGKGLESETILGMAAPFESAEIRIAADLSNDQALIANFCEFLAMGPREVADLSKVLPEIKTIRGRIDFSSDNLLELSMTTRKKEEMGRLKAGADSLIETILLSFDSQPAGPEEMREMKALVEEMMDSLRADSSDEAVTIVMKKPSDFEARLKTMIPSLVGARDRNQKMNDMKQICLAMHNFVDARLEFPQFNATTSKNDLSWRISMLPYLEEQELYDAIDHEGDFDSDQNKAFADRMPLQFGKDGKSSRITAVKTERPVKSFRDITDGTSNTIAFVEVDRDLPWMEENDLTIDEIVDAVKTLKTTFMVGMYDGSVRMLEPDIEPEKLRALLTPAGGELIDW